MQRPGKEEQYSVGRQQTINRLLARFEERYGKSEQDIRVFWAPGRVNLIGEHTDYNGGYVFPAALTFGTTMLVRKRGDKKIRLASENFSLSGEVDPDRLVYDADDGWMNYPKAMIDQLQKKGYRFSGYDILYGGEIPHSSGLSSSASILVVTGYGLMRMEGAQMNLVDLALTAQQAENRFLGVNCGIMDPFVIAMGKREHAIRLLCSTLDYEYIPLRLNEYRIVIGNTNKKRGLVDSEYNARRAQCQKALLQLRQAFPDLEALAELNMEQLKEHSDRFQDDTVRKRAWHVVAEHERVIRSVEALKRGDLNAFGQLMVASHESLRDLYEVSCMELDVMVEAILQCDGVLGARMTGAGFGGCTVSIVHRDHVPSMIEQVTSRYREQTGLKPEFYIAEIGSGVHEWE